MEKFDLTFPEKNIWLVENFYESKKINIISGSLVIKKDFDISLAEKTVNEYVRLNDAMRIKICIENNTPKQYVSEYVEFKADKVDVRAKTEEEIEKIKEEYISTPINVIDNLLFSYLLIDRGEGVGEIFLKAHHLICDAWSISKMGTQLSHIYEALLNNEKYEKEIPSYLEFISSEQEYLNSEKYQKDKLFWQEYLDGMIDVAGLKEESATENTDGKRYTFVLEDKFKLMLDEYIKENRVSYYSIFLTALAIYLERTNEKQDFAIGTPILNRSNFKEKNMAGMFVSTMPVRFKIDENETFLELCKKTALDSMTLFRHQKYPYSKMSEEYKENNNVTNNMYKVMLSYQNARAELADNDKYEVLWRFSGNIQDSLEIHIMDMNNTGKLMIHMDYLTSLFEDIEIEYLSKRLLAIIEDGIKNNKTIGTIDIMPIEERNKILYEFNNTKRDYPKDKTVIDLFEEQVAKTPNKVALTFENNEMTYSELNEKANKLANYLNKMGVKEFDSVGIIIDKSFDLLISIIAVLKLGAFYLPLELNYSHDKKDYMLSDTKAKVVITDNFEEFDIPTIVFSELNIDELEEKQFSRDKKYNEESPVCILYTSGTTGEPKGAIIINKNIVKLVKNPDYMEFSEDDVILQAASTSFDVSLFEFWGTLLNGGVCALIKKNNLLNFDYLSEYVKEKNVSVAWITAALFNQIIDARIDIFSNLRLVLSGGDVMSIKHVNKLREKYSNLTIINCYGPTECTTFTNTNEIKKIQTKRIPLGRAISNTYGYVLDSKFRLLPLYTEGEYVIGGDSVGLKYINKEELSKEKFVQDTITNKGRMYKTGDVVQMIEGGKIDFIGRRDNQVKIRGFRIELNEIRLAILSYYNMKDASVFVMEDESNNKKIVAYYVSNNNIETVELKKFLKEKLPSHMVPSYLEQIEKLPLNQNGKVNIKSLKHIAMLNMKNLKEEFNIEYKGLRKKIYDIFSDILDKKDIYPDDNFFEIGGDSLSAIRLITEAISKDINITFADLYKYPSIDELANLLEEDKTKSSMSLGIEKIDYTNINKLLENNKMDASEIRMRKLGNVLLTGSTGFLGAHILSYLLDNSNDTIYCLVRKTNTDTPEDRLKERLRFFFGNKYDKLFGSRIKVVEGDVVLENITKNEQDKKVLEEQVDTIINSAAHVKHFGKIDLFEKINYNGVENLAKFAYENKKKFIQISTLSVSGNILEVGQIEQTNIKKGTIYNENSFYIGQNLDNVYAYTKFMGEKIVYDYILKGLDAKIMRMGNLTSRLSDGKFQPNVEENAFANRLKTIIDLNVIPDNILNFYLEFTPIDCAAEAICILSKLDTKHNTFHLFNHNHMQMVDADKIFNEVGIHLKHITKEEMTELIDYYSNQENGSDKIKGIVQDINKNKELDYTPSTIIKSDFTIEILSKLGFKWPIIEKEYIKRYLEYLRKINFLKGEK